MNPALPKTNLVVTLELRIRPRSLQKTLVIAHDLTDSSRKEDGCITYLISQSLDDPSRFLIFMVWRDADAYHRHAESPYVRAFANEIAREILEKRGASEQWHSVG